MDPLKSQTATATPAEPGAFVWLRTVPPDLPRTVSPPLGLTDVSRGFGVGGCMRFTVGAIGVPSPRRSRRCRAAVGNGPLGSP
jgi:hypothetical protein